MLVTQQQLVIATKIFMVTNKNLAIFLIFGFWKLQNLNFK